ncbi:amino acid ABC transporter substrate-binding protein [Sphingobacterium sp. SGG-5]|uniref:ABC transporter substrate-binding protein n=1 Tax=Sphingobacterium sp. SGG-5 TaxID=2710881 RepID=UPI0013EB66AE|nr:amino acid ABC transporter substrate-binding protein [Sphingobacterium sp. SGG-5]NGM62018.1 amino acid ABC transporter substrate-binding protein [Sphingobacterium sp. SGG-5]
MKNIFVLYITCLLFGISACTPKVGVLRSPEYKGNVGAGTDTKANRDDASDKAIKDAAAGKKNLLESNIALVLPFQLDQISTSAIMEKDVKRSALALDFYQGFQLGLEESSKDGKDFALHVLDSRDNDIQNATLAKSEAVEDAAVVVGPVYPKEIKSFGQNLSNKNILQINPLAASMPSEFNLPNLVSLTPSIKMHSNAIGQAVAKEYSVGDVIVLYNTTDSDGRQFLSGMLGVVKQAAGQAHIVSVSSIAQLNEQLANGAVTHVVTGTTDKLQIRLLVTNLFRKVEEENYNIRLYGHPLWDRFDWSVYPNFSNLKPKISSESTMKEGTNVRKFREMYQAAYGVQPSDHSFKGYDCARYFGTLLAKYGKDQLKDKLVEEPYEGLYSRYRFTHNATWGYVNEAVAIRMYRYGGFELY